LLAPIFDGGTLLHQQRGARAAYQQAAEQYRGTVLTAFQNVADTLSALDHDAEGLKSTSAATDAAKTSLDLSRLRFKDGYDSYLAVLNAEQAYQEQRLSLVQAQAARFADTAALFQALGGGWWHQPELTSAANAR
jgi:outer membrane protein TolC